jgi:hypothetical protein
MLKAPNRDPSLIPERKRIGLSEENPQLQKKVHLLTAGDVRGLRGAATVDLPGEEAVRVLQEPGAAVAAAALPVLPNPENVVDQFYSTVSGTILKRTCRQLL